MTLLSTWTPLRSLAENTGGLSGVASPTCGTSQAATTITTFFTDCPAHLRNPLAGRVSIIMGTSVECHAVTGWNPSVLGDPAGMFRQVGTHQGQVWLDAGTHGPTTLLHEWGHAVDYLGAASRMTLDEPLKTWWSAIADVRAANPTLRDGDYYGWANISEFFAELFMFHWQMRSTRLSSSARTAAEGDFDRLFTGPGQNTNLSLPAQAHAWFDGLALTPPSLSV